MSMHPPSCETPVVRQGGPVPRGGGIAVRLILPCGPWHVKQVCSKRGPVTLERETYARFARVSALTSGAHTALRLPGLRSHRYLPFALTVCSKCQLRTTAGFRSCGKVTGCGSLGLGRDSGRAWRLAERRAMAMEGKRAGGWGAGKAASTISRLRAQVRVLLSSWGSRGRDERYREHGLSVMLAAA